LNQFTRCYTAMMTILGGSETMSLQRLAVTSTSFTQ
jgi:hypothetical protein